MRGHLTDLAQSVRGKREEAVMYDITEAMASNRSFFFRDRKPFDQFRNTLLPHLLQTRAGKADRIWIRHVQWVTQHTRSP